MLRDVPPVKAPGTAEFRKLMSLFTTGVCVVSVESDDHGLAAMTVNSFVSVSLDPMLVCWSLHNSSSQFDLFASAEDYAVSILAEGQADLAMRYAARADSLLLKEDFTRSRRGLPVISGSLGHFECAQWSRYPAGDHTMILGEVKGLSGFPEQDDRISPLGFFNGQFCSIGK